MLGTDSFALELIVFGQVILIDLVLAGDNIIVIGMAAAQVLKAQRTRVIFWGMIAAAVLRILFSLLAVQLLHVIGLTLAGGLLLLWVWWKLLRETRQAQHAPPHAEDTDDANAPDAPGNTGKSMRVAICQVVVADLAMSLDNVLAVAGAARDHWLALISGLVLSVALMGIAARVIAPLFQRWPWLSYLGLAVILYVALEMIWSGSGEVFTAFDIH